MTRRVVITGVGAVTPLGIGSDPLIDRWTAGESGIVDGFGRCLEFEPNSVHDRNHGSGLEFKSRQHRAEFVNRQRIVTVQHHIPTPVARSDNEQLYFEIVGCLPLRENLQYPLSGRSRTR